MSYKQYTELALEMAEKLKEAKNSLDYITSEKNEAKLAFDWVKSKLDGDREESAERDAFHSRFYRPAKLSYDNCFAQWQKMDAEYKNMLAAMLEPQYIDDLKEETSRKLRFVDDKQTLIRNMEEATDLTFIKEKLGETPMRFSMEECLKAPPRFTKHSIATAPQRDPNANPDITPRTNAAIWYKPMLVLELVTMPGTNSPMCGVCFYDEYKDGKLTFEVLDEEDMHGTPRKWASCIKAPRC
jgi:hypothetical protein